MFVTGKKRKGKKNERKKKDFTSKNFVWSGTVLVPGFQDLFFPHFCRADDRAQKSCWWPAEFVFSLKSYMGHPPWSWRWKGGAGCWVLPGLKTQLQADLWCSPEPPGECTPGCLAKRPRREASYLCFRRYLYIPLFWQFPYSKTGIIMPNT